MLPVMMIAAFMSAAWAEKPIDEQVAGSSDEAGLMTIYAEARQHPATQRIFLRALSENSARNPWYKQSMRLKQNVREALNNSDPLVLSEAIKAAGAMKIENVQDRLMEIFENAGARYGADEVQVQTAAVKAMIQLQPDNLGAQLCGLLEQRLRYPLESTFLAILQGLAEHADASCKETIAKARSVLNTMKKAAPDDPAIAQACNEYLAAVSLVEVQISHLEKGDAHETSH